MYKIQLKTREYKKEGKRIFLLITLPDGKTKAYDELGLKLLEIDPTDKKTLKADKERHNAQEYEKAEAYKKSLLKILNEYGFTLEDLLRHVKTSSLEEIVRELEAGKTKKDLSNKARFNDMLFIDYVNEHLDKKIKVKKIRVGGKLVDQKIEEGNIKNYRFAANKFFESVGYYTPATRISWQHVNDFVAKAKDIDFKADQITSIIPDFIELNKSLLKENTSIQTSQLVNYLQEHGVKLKVYNSQRKRHNVEHYKEQCICERIMSEFWMYIGRSLRVNDLTDELLTQFSGYLTEVSGMKNNYYFQLICSVVSQLENKNVIEDVTLFAQKPEFSKALKREYLTVDEINKLLQTPWPGYEKHRLAFLFSTQAGLRWSDINRLRWTHIHQDGFLRLPEQKKTKYPVEVPLTELAQEILSELTTPDAKLTDTVFAPFQPSPYAKARKSGNDSDGYFGMTAQFTNWLKAAGIENKHITYHCSRHSFCQNLLDSGVDGFIVSELLGHIDVEMIRSYMRITAKKKMEALGQLPLLTLKGLERREFYLKHK